MLGRLDAASNWERDWQEHVKSWGFQHGLNSKNLFHHGRNRVSELTHGDDFALIGPTKKTDTIREQDGGCVSNESKTHQLRVIREHQTVEQKVALDNARNCVSAPSQTCRRARERLWTWPRQLRADTSNARSNRKREARAVEASSAQ